MQINTDTIFLQGSDHQVCEDYATNFGSVEGSNRIILCDGCSSSLMTDVGARLLALETSYIIPRWAHYNSIDIILQTLKDRIKFMYDDFLRINPFMFDATLLFAFEKENKINFGMYGDGVVIYKFKNVDTVTIINREFKSSYPNYFSYQLDNLRKENYLKLNESCNLSYYNDDNLMSVISNDLDFHSDYFFIEGEDRLEWILLMSDGIHSFYKINEQGKREYIDFLEIIKKLIDFKNYHGIFVQRQVKSLMKQLKKENIFHYDDFSVAGLYVKEGE